MERKQRCSSQPNGVSLRSYPDGESAIRTKSDRIQQRRMAIPYPDPGEDKKLERLERGLNIAKMQAEIAAAEHQLSRGIRFENRVKAIGSLVTILTLFVTVGGLYLSSNHWLEDSRQSRIQDAIKQLGGETEDAKRFGIMALREFLISPSSDQRHQALVVLSSALEGGPSDGVRQAIVAAFENVDEKLVGSRELTETVNRLAEVSRRLVRTGSLWTKRSPVIRDDPPENSEESKARAVARSIVALIRKGAHPRDLSGIYLVDSDLQTLDLSRVHFDNSILAWSNFNNATLTEASFNGADLDRVSFAGPKTNLQGAYFVYREESGYPVYRYFDRVLPHPNPRPDKSPRITDPEFTQSQVTGPDFSEADLTRAHFDGYDLFPLYPDRLFEKNLKTTEIQSEEYESALRVPGSVSQSNFSKARLDGTDFSKAVAFGVVLGMDPRLPLAPLAPMNTTTIGTITRYRAAIGDWNLDRAGAAEFFITLTRISASFAGSNWRSAKFPRAIQEFLNICNPSSPMDCKPSALQGRSQ
jgi:uncharacterized protein YjbI with pentapeptide repeats